MTRETKNAFWVLAGLVFLVSKASASWTIEIVDQNLGPHWADDGEKIGFAVDSLGRPQFSYYDANTGDLMYALEEGGTWTIEAIDDQASGEAGWVSSIAIDADNVPHVCYLVRGVIDKVRYAVRTGGVWTREDPHPSIANCGEQSDIAVGPDGNPRISFWDDSNGRLMYGVRNADWTIIEVEGVECRGGTAVGPGKIVTAGDAHINNAVMFYSRRILGGWDEEHVMDCDEHCSTEHPRLKFDTGGEPHVVWNLDVHETDTTNIQAHTMYAQKDTTGYWEYETAVSYYDMVLDTHADLGLDSDGEPLIVYPWWETSSRFGSVMLARRIASNNWYREVAVEVAGDFPFMTMVAVDRWNNIHIGIRGEDMLYYARPSTAVDVSAGTNAGKGLWLAPNPVGSEGTTVFYRLPAPAPADLTIYDITGRVVRTLRSGESSAPRASVYWDGRDREGREVSAGTYFLRLHGRDGTVLSRKVSVLR